MSGFSKRLQSARRGGQCAASTPTRDNAQRKRLSERKPRKRRERSAPRFRDFLENSE